VEAMAPGNTLLNTNIWGRDFLGTLGDLFRSKGYREGGER